MKKRGLSTVITSLIIILLVLIAVGIVWVVVKNIISEGVEDISLEKFTLDLKIKNVNVDNSTNNISTYIKRNPGKGDLVGIKFIFNDGINSEVFEYEIIIPELGERSFSFILSQLPIDNVATVSIAPIYETSSGKKMVGHITDTYRIKEGIGSECIVNCTGKECGSDGCGGLCPPGCGTGYYCQDGTCIAGTPPCDLTSASWSHTTVVEGTLVTLNVVGTNCAGIDLNYSIYEDDLIGDDFITSFVAASLSQTWTAEWVNDGVGDPEYYFVVTVVDNPSENIKSSDPLLTVTQAALTCAEAGGTCMSNQCSTYTDCTSLTGTCATGYCCSGTCTTPTESQVTRGFSSTSVSQGDIVTVTLDVSIIGGETYYTIEEYIPTGWTIIDDDGGVTADPYKLAWAVIQGAVDTTYTYTVQAPSSAGNYVFDGIYMFEGFSSSITTKGQTTVSVS